MQLILQNTFEKIENFFILTQHMELYFYGLIV